MLLESTLEILMRSPIYNALVGIGFKANHFDNIRLRGNRDGIAFCNWSFSIPQDLPIDAILYAKSFAVLRCLHEEKSISSLADRDAAWKYVAAAEAAAVAESAEKVKRGLQSERAQRPRVKILENGKTLKDIIKSIVDKHPDVSVSELWSKFLSTLERECLNPIRASGENGKPTPKAAFTGVGLM